MLRIQCRNKKPDFEKNEMKQYNELVSLLYEKYKESPEQVFLFVDYIILNKQIDVIFLKKNAIIIIEMKGYSGKIHGNENGEWTVVTANGEVTIETENENPFGQVKQQRMALIHFLGKELPKINPRFSEEIDKLISGWLYFNDESSYDFGQINENAYLWFDLVTPSDIVEKIDDEYSREFLFSPEEMNQIAEKSLKGYKNTPEEILKLEKPEGVSKQKQPVSYEFMKKFQEDVKTLMENVSNRDKNLENVVKEVMENNKELLKEYTNVQIADIKKLLIENNDAHEKEFEKAVNNIKEIEKSVDKKFEKYNKGLDDHRKSIDATLNKKLDLAENRKFPTKRIITLIIVVIIVLSALFLCQKLEQIFNNTMNNFRNMVNDTKNWMPTNKSTVTMNPSYTAYPPHTTIWTVNTTKGLPVYISDLAWALLDSSTNANTTGASINILDNDGDTYLTSGDTISVTASTDEHYIFVLVDKNNGMIFRSE